MFCTVIIRKTPSKRGVLTAFGGVVDGFSHAKRPSLAMQKAVNKATVYGKQECKLRLFAIKRDVCRIPFSYFMSFGRHSQSDVLTHCHMLSVAFCHLQ